jgi:uncharacterized protein
MVMPSTEQPPAKRINPGFRPATIRAISGPRPICPILNVLAEDVFWAPKIETNRSVTIRYAFDKCEVTGRVENFVRAAEALRGELADKDRKLPGYPFDDMDAYKVIEGASYALSVAPDLKLDAYVDGPIQKIAAAQEPDGYIYSARTISPEPPACMVGEGAVCKRRRPEPGVV